MATALQRLVRRTILAKLKADAPLIAVVPAASIYTQTTPPDPVWPFMKCGPFTTQRLKAAEVNGGIVTFDLHAFARPRKDAGAVVETAEDYAGRIGGLIEAALADERMTLGTGEIIRVSLSDMQLMQDDDPDAFHYVAQVNCRVLAS